MVITNKISEFINFEEAFQIFLKRYYQDEIVQLPLFYPEKRSLVINFFDLDNYNTSIAGLLLDKPDEFFSAATNVLSAITSLRLLKVEEAGSKNPLNAPQEDGGAEKFKNLLFSPVRVSLGKRKKTPRGVTAPLRRRRRLMSKHLR